MPRCVVSVRLCARGAGGNESRADTIIHGLDHGRTATRDDGTDMSQLWSASYGVRRVQSAMQLHAAVGVDGGAKPVASQTRLSFSV